MARNGQQEGSQLSPAVRASTLRVLFVRHGETEYNVKGIIQGQMDTPLNGRGRTQALVTGKSLRNTQIDAVYSSPLQRTADTALAIVHQNRSLSPIPVHYDPRLKERSFGALEGNLTRARKNALAGTGGASDIEESSALSGRLTSFWNDLINGPDDGWLEKAGGTSQSITPSRGQQEAKASGSGSGSGSGTAAVGQRNAGYARTILIVGHGAALGALLEVVKCYALSAPGLAITRLWNCSITEVHVPVALLGSAKSGDGVEMQGRSTGYQFDSPYQLEDHIAVRQAYRIAEESALAKVEKLPASQEEQTKLLANVKLSDHPAVQKARDLAELAQRARAEATGILFVRWADISHLEVQEADEADAVQFKQDAPGVTRTANADEIPARDDSNSKEDDEWQDVPDDVRNGDAKV